MKLNIFKSSLFLLAGVALASCSEGKYWDEAKNPGEVYAFTKPAETITVPADSQIPSTIDVTVTRNTSVGSATVPVTFESSTPLITGPASVTFNDGSFTANYTVSLADGLFAGVKYTAKLTLEQPENALTHVKAENLVFSLSVSKVLVLDWKDAGEAPAFSGWGGNEDPINLPVQVATNYPSDELRLCRFITPYKYLDPNHTQDDANLEFYIDNDGNAAGMAATWQYMGQNDSENGYYYFGGVGAYAGTGFTNEGNIYTMAGVVGYTEKLGGAVNAGWYETIMFQWDAPAK